MGNGATERGILGLLRVNMDKLVIKSGIGKIVNAILINLEPL